MNRNENRIRTQIHRAVDHAASGLTTNPYLAQRVLAKAKGNGEVKVKKKLSLGFILVLVLILATVTALAVTMLEDLQNVWNDSFNRMNTTGAFDAVDRGGFDAEAFEKEYKENTGLETKGDLIISTVPDENGISYEQAYQIARSAILDTFGTPESELDAMGIYPTYYETYYTDEKSEWDIYFTPRTNTDIDLDHDYPGPGEYRVYVSSPSGEITFINWYIDDFWPSYAKRTWEAGKHDYVYSRAANTDFFTQSVEDQKYFISLFASEGYDVTVLDKSKEEQLSSMDLALMFAEKDKNIINSGDKAVEAALSVMESTYGLTRDLLDKYCFIALPSPLKSETTDICFAYNYEIEWSRLVDGTYDRAADMLVSYAGRLGMYMICLDPDTQRVTNSVHCDREPRNEACIDESLLLGRKNWTVADMPLYDELMAKLQALDEKYQAGEMSYDMREAEICYLMRTYGGDPDIYKRHTLSEDGLTEDALWQLAAEAVAKQNSMTAQQVLEAYPYHALSFDGYGHFEIYLLTTTDQSGWYVTYDLSTGNITTAVSNGNG